ncbi:F-box protein CPR1-like [Rutidosis leptorrhynchoides]|uniref:F-box protein CPR1-like n=1 Tax=Rutidosis leptorrhynchoides TaxID=125765 RepID=UPI003A99B986
MDDDVVAKILVRLDVEDVVRCKSVCKSWYNLISSNDFVNAHLKRSYNNNREHGYKRIRLLKLRDYMMIGSCNGLICISLKFVELLVTNPSTREVRKLPMPPYNYRGKVCWGFGYDSCTDDYKVVVGFEESKHHMRFQVLSLKSNQWKSLKPTKWKFVEDRDHINYNTNTYDCTGFLYNGALHWFMDDDTKKKKKKKVILSFDLSLEKFKEIPLPNDRKYVYDGRNIIGVFEERLCICISKWYDCFASYDLQTWVMKSCNGWHTIWVMKNDNCWERLPRDYEGNKYGSVTPAYKLDFIQDNTWHLCNDKKGKIDLSLKSWYHIAFPIFVKSLVSPLEKKKKKKKE